ncbi:MAG: RtcB family protein [bacterium]|nr:RtcB family protein [bacterium]
MRGGDSSLPIAARSMNLGDCRQLKRSNMPKRRPKLKTVPYRIWGENIEAGALQQMENACSLPVSILGALMPDAHQGYGLPIGGVLAVRDAVIPYAVGMDIACRMRLSVYELPLAALTDDKRRLCETLERNTLFGVGGGYRVRKQHPVLDEDWTVSSVTKGWRDRAWAQLGTSGHGNHFAEFGVFTLKERKLGLPAGEYVALLTHSGSRGTGAEIARHFSRLAASLHQELPPGLKQLAWLELDSEPGREYWAAMELMGRYAAAGHEIIHRDIAVALGQEVLLSIENHHNFAWREQVHGRNAVVHRKGATPAGRDDIGIIPGSMATPAFIVRGKGVPESLNSAAHGAGRRMSRKAAKTRFSNREMQNLLSERGVKLISAALDEIPLAYKDIHEVMAAQQDLVEVLGRFDPRIVKMAR